MYKDKGLLLVLSGPAGVGKGTVCSHLRKKNPSVQYSVSCTTRSPRDGEVDGVNYFFKTKDEFKEMIHADQLLEWAQYVNHYYGTPIDYVMETINKGKDIILEIEVQGALKVRDRFPDAVFIFLMPPSLVELEKRIVGRGTETDEVIQKRLAVARKEMELMKEYDYVVENDEIEHAVRRIQSIITAEHCKRARVFHKYKKKMEVH